MHVHELTHYSSWKVETKWKTFVESFPALQECYKIPNQTAEVRRAVIFLLKRTCFHDFL